MEGADRKLSCSRIEKTDDGREVESLITKMIEDELTFANGDLQRVFNASLGCTLIRKNVLHKFKFRYEKGKDAFPDYFFAVDMFTQGISVFVDTKQLCVHENQDWGLYGVNYK